MDVETQYTNIIRELLASTHMTASTHTSTAAPSQWRQATGLWRWTTPKTTAAPLTYKSCSSVYNYMMPQLDTGLAMKCSSKTPYPGYPLSGKGMKFLTSAPGSLSFWQHQVGQSYSWRPRTAWCCPLSTGSCTMDGLPHTDIHPE